MQSRLWVYNVHGLGCYVLQILCTHIHVHVCYALVFAYLRAVILDPQGCIMTEYVALFEYYDCVCVQ